IWARPHSKAASTWAKRSSSTSGPSSTVTGRRIACCRRCCEDDRGPRLILCMGYCAAAVRRDLRYDHALANFWEEPPMRALLIAGVAVVAAIGPALAAVLAPNEIQATFFTGQPFTASATNIKYKMVFTADGKMTREPAGGGGSKSEGTW